MSAALNERITAINTTLRELLGEVLFSNDDACKRSLSDVLEFALGRLKGERQAEPIRFQFDREVQSLNPEECGQRFIDLCNGSKCVRKDFERIDYHVESSATWIITIPESDEEILGVDDDGNEVKGEDEEPGEADEEIEVVGDDGKVELQISYLGNDHNGTYRWYFRHYQGESARRHGITLSSENQNHVYLAEELGLEMAIAARFFNLMFIASFP